MQGRTATVSLGPGHAGATAVTVVLHGAHIRFTFPGLPQNVVFEGTLRKSRIEGTVRQGALRGAFALRRGLSRILPLLGVYRAPDGSAVAVMKAETFAPWLVEIPSGATHGIGASLNGRRQAWRHIGQRHDRSRAERHRVERARTTRAWSLASGRFASARTPPR